MNYKTSIFKRPEQHNGYRMGNEAVRDIKWRTIVINLVFRCRSTIVTFVTIGDCMLY